MVCIGFGLRSFYDTSSHNRLEWFSKLLMSLPVICIWYQLKQGEPRSLSLCHCKRAWSYNSGLNICTHNYVKYIGNEIEHVSVLVISKCISVYKTVLQWDNGWYKRHLGLNFVSKGYALYSIVLLSDNRPILFL